MKLFKYIIFTFALVFFYSCEKVFLKPNPETSNIAIFEEYVSVVKEKYAMLDIKGVNIDELAKSLRPIVEKSTTKEELYNVLSQITLSLKDAHSSLDATTDNKMWYTAFDFLEGYNKAFDLNILHKNYISTSTDIKILKDEQGVEKLLYGSFKQAPDIGYIGIQSFNIELTDDELETIFRDLNEKKGLIIDIRQNTGGDPLVATKIASYFIPNNISIGYEKFKIGPDADDFAVSDVKLKPASSDYIYQKPVVVLVDRYVYSAATTLCYSLSPMENVTFIGQRTGGGSGSVAAGYLANGWIWNLSVSEFVGVDRHGKEQHLDNGFDPDIIVSFNAEVTTNDEILDRAIQELN